MTDPAAPAATDLPRLLKALARFRRRARAAQNLGIPMPFRRRRKAALLATLRRDWTGAYVAGADGHLAFVPAPLDFQGEHVLFNGLAAHPVALAFLPAGGVALDVGANLGEWAVPCAEAVGRDGTVLAFEPNPPVADALERTLAINNLPQVRVLRLALSDRAGQTRFTVDAANSGASRLAGTGEGLVVETRTLDAVVAEQGLDRIDLVKIDVEGHERPVLEGARQTLGRWRPAVIIESGHEGVADRRAIAALFADLAYAPAAMLCGDGALPCGIEDYLGQSGACAGAEPRNLLFLPG